MIREGICSTETIPSVSSINRVLRNISAKEKVMKRKSKCWEGVREKMEPRQSLEVKQEEVKSDSGTRGEDNMLICYVQWCNGLHTVFLRL